ncbi:MAG: segregation/condensation protein A [Spirochaetales bacterium]|nr:segregation/condensation protein A [Spirochaetales bacterium]
MENQDVHRTEENQSQSKAENKPSFKLKEFEGPLDLLLYLIRKAEVNIYDIPISQITEQYLEYLKYMTKVDLENITDFYILASTLLYIKSKMLLPVDADFDDDIEDPRQDLVEKLIEYQKFKKLTELIEDKEKETEWHIERKKQQMILPFEEDEIWEKAQIWDLLKIFSSIVSSINTERIIDLYGEVTVNEKITLIRELLEEKDEFLFTELIKQRNSLHDVICSFLAILEMVKSRYITVYQNLLFGDIKITKRVEKEKQELEEMTDEQTERD